MESQMLRFTLDKLEKSGSLKTCKKRVDKEFELGAVLRYFDNEVPILFKNIKNYDIDLVGGVYGNRKIFNDLMDVNEENRIYKFMDAIANPKSYKEVKSGPIAQNIITKSIDIKKLFPIPTSHEKDSSNFITAGMLIIKDPETNDIHMAVRRFQINDKDNISALVSGASPHLNKIIKKAELNNEKLECAIVLGYDAEFLIASQISSSKYGLDKYEVYSSLKNEPLEVIKCSSVDILVPAFCEIVIEGYLDPNKKIKEGPFGELMGYYGEVSNHPTIDVKAIMHRDNPIFQHAFPSREEHLSNGLIREVEIYSALKNIVDVIDVNVTIGGGCRLHAVVKINKKNEGDGKSSILTALGSSKDLKHVVIVDDDVDIYNYKDVEFAIASRVQASEDVIIIPNALGSPLEASHVNKGLSDKMGIDATKPLDNELFNRAIIPGYENINIDDYF
ncbi:MAG: UbiD family decarboxylase [Paraclostridium bifermentans]|uniref:UbiD family decarboxylase n=1 Tax=Paraclostridium bifermentans TaxID=1490 RepID=UPI001DA55E66|nr:UbiD family decarboxylase [Paraclostridium bifermentans]MBS6507878.1 UbiD family decarboxylase [Paraclostridium bifermentans]